MLLLDYNQISLSNLFAQTRGYDINENLARHTILSCALSYKKQFGDKYGEIVFCADGRGDYWRKKVFPYYKANRKKARQSSGVNWQPIFEALNKIRTEIRENLPFKMLMIATAEADDIIATMVQNYYEREPILIISGDQDFIQLQKYKNVRQYASIQRRFITHDNPVVYLREKILRGDPGDGVPNFLSDDDCFVAPDKRQQPLREKALQVYLKQDPSEYGDKLFKNYKRNEKLVDLIDNIPPDISKEVISSYENYGPLPSKSSMLQYFMKNDLKILTERAINF